jgi:hypothetical protein
MSDSCPPVPFFGVFSRMMRQANTPLPSRPSDSSVDVISQLMIALRLLHNALVASTSAFEDFSGERDD